MKRSEIEDLEISLLLKAISKRYGYDFSHYSAASIKRRIKHFLANSEFNSISELIPRLIDDKTFFETMIRTLTITVTEMFRDPPFYKAIRKKVVPILKTYPFIKIWHAGCATGEEVYSMAILLKEEGLYERAMIYATDINEEALEKAKKGIFQIDFLKKYTSNYQSAGGKEPFSDYYSTGHESAIMKSWIKKNILFSVHNLVTDSAFGEMHLILCRNVLIYFDKTLQNRVFSLFYDSLVLRGFLCLGSKEGIQFSNAFDKFKKIDKKENIYQAERK